MNNTRITNNQGNTKIIIDAGHGGFDPGGGSNEYFKEKDKNLQISKYQKKRFDELGIPAVLVRSDDTTLTPRERLAKITELGADDNDILISNHINTGNSSGGEVIYSIRGTKQLPDEIANELKKSGLPIRNVYKRIGRNGNDYYFVLRGTKPNNAMIIEYGFASDPKDTNRLINNWNVLAESVVEAISNYLEVPYQAPKQTIYTVKKGDSLYSIAKAYKINPEDIVLANGLSSTTLYPGTSLIIPNE